MSHARRARRPWRSSSSLRSRPSLAILGACFLSLITLSMSVAVAAPPRWEAPVEVSGEIASGIAAASWGPGRLDVFAAGPGGELLHRYRVGSGPWLPSGTWEAHDPPPAGPLDGELGEGGIRLDPAAVSWGGPTQRIDVFVTAPDDLAPSQDVVWWKRWDGVAWSGWQKTGAPSVPPAVDASRAGSPSESAAGISAPAVASRGPGLLDVFVRGQDGQLYINSYDRSDEDNDSDGWSGWSSPAPGRLTSAPAAVSWDRNNPSLDPDAKRLDVFARGADDGLWHLTRTSGRWGAWRSVGGQLASSPDVASWAANRLDVVVRGADNLLYRTAWDGGWSGWEHVKTKPARTHTADPGVLSWGSDQLAVFTRVDCQTQGLACTPMNSTVMSFTTCDRALSGGCPMVGSGEIPAALPDPDQISFRGYAEASVQQNVTCDPLCLNGPTTLSIDRPVPTQPGDPLRAGDVMLAVIDSGTWNKNAPAGGGSDGWQLVRRDADLCGGAQSLYSRVVLDPASEPDEFTWTLGADGQSAAGVIGLYRGVDPETPIDGVSGHSDGGGAPLPETDRITAPSVTAVTGSRLVFAGSIRPIGKSSMYPPMGMTVRRMRSDTTHTMLLADEVWLATGPTGDRVASASSMGCASVGQMVALAPLDTSPDPDRELFSTSVGFVDSTQADNDGRDYRLLTLPRPDAERGDLLVAFIHSEVSQPTSAPFGWVPIRTDVATGCTEAGGLQRYLTAYWFVNDGADSPFTWAFDPQGSFAAGIVVAYRGVDVRAPVHASSGSASTSSDSMSAPSVAAVRGSRVVFAGSTALDQAITPPASMASRGTVSASVGALNVSDELASRSGSTGDRVGRADTATCAIGQMVAITPNRP